MGLPGLCHKSSVKVGFAFLNRIAAGFSHVLYLEDYVETRVRRSMGEG